MTNNGTDDTDELPRNVAEMACYSGLKEQFEQLKDEHGAEQAKVALVVLADEIVNTHTTRIRPPTNREREAVLRRVEGLWDKQVRRAHEQDNRPLIVVEDYTTDSPGYTGPVCIVLHEDASASLFGLYEDPDTGEVGHAEPLGGPSESDSPKSAGGA